MISISKHKKRFDRGGHYQGYLQFPVTVLMAIKIFDIENYWFYVIAVFLAVLLRYILGVIDELAGILNKEQKRYFDDNPVFSEINKKLDYIKGKV